MSGRPALIFKKAGTSLLNSYSMIFFSKNHAFAAMLVIVSFFDPIAGLGGLIAVLTANFTAYLIGFNRNNILAGVYGFNAVLVGLGIGVYFQFSLVLLILIIFAALLTLFLTLFFEGVIGKYGLPFLTLSFLFTFWLVTLAARRYTQLNLSERGIFTYNEFYYWGGFAMVKAYDWFNDLKLPLALSTYFKSLSAILFQYHLLPGILIGIGLIYYSRIAFVLSLLGFYSAYLFYHFIGADFNELNYSYIGFNFILTAIAIGGFFIISSRISFLWVILLTPIISILLSSSSEFLGYFQLSTYSFPFNIVVILFLYMLRFREKPDKKLELVTFQEFSPEKNLYNQKNSKTRFRGYQYFPFGLPFMGEWKVTQGHSGEHTHKGIWRHAWDFEIADENDKNHSGKGTSLSDFYCYNKPVIAPADGWIEEIVDSVDDNQPHEINIEQNWGNSIVIKHLDGLYSKLSHIKKGSFSVEKGQFVRKGDKLALCGNSGRSPEPHLHFQLQATPYIGSATLDYPLGRYMLVNEKQFELLTWERPAKGDRLSNIESIQSLKKAFNFIPGQKLSYLVQENGKPDQSENWVVEVDIYNFTYLRCLKTESQAWFRNEDDLLYFTAFQGDKSSLLYAFYLGAYKIARGFYPGLKIVDEFPVTVMQTGIRKILQDFLAPFYLFVHTEYRMEYKSMQDEINQTQVTLNATITQRTSFKSKQIAGIGFHIDHDRIEQIILNRKSRIITCTCQDNPDLTS
ncbi:MAG: urea transporter [Bacteroidetes bacterium]|nr:urea transporter [Bacteroidota bacterium]